MKLSLTVGVIFCALIAPAYAQSEAQPAPTSAAETPARRKVTNASELPAYTYQLPSAPSELLAGPVKPVLALADALAADDARTLAQFEVKDLATREDILDRAIAAALLRRDVAGVHKLTGELRALQERADRRLTAGVISDIVVEACASGDPAATATRLANEKLKALPYDKVDSWVKQTRAGLSTANADLIIGSIRQQLDPIAAGNGNKVDQHVAASIVQVRAALECQIPVAPPLAAVFASVIDAQAAKTPTVDIWADRQVSLTAAMPGKPVAVAIWDAGVDMTLFKAADDPGFAIDGQGRPMADALLRPAGDYATRLDELMDRVKGSMDLQASLPTPEATQFQATMRNLKPDQAKAFIEDMGFIGNYVHGTHVAGIVTAGNPFARVQAVSMHWPHRQEELRLDRAIAERRATFYADAVKRMRKAGVRVVNMSWRIGPAAFEQILQVQGGMPDSAERKRVATELFAIEKSALEAAIRSAPQILFVAGAGNETNDANFADYIPAGIRAPNLLTVGAVDKAGREALFTSTGGTVAVHANGVEVESFFPGGKRRALSGTSMASPQVANTAAKLVALKPELSGAQLRTLLVDTAEAQGRVRLLNPKLAFEKAGVKL